MLGHVVQLTHSHIHLRDTVALLSRRTADFADDVVHTLNTPHDFVHRLAGVAHQFCARTDLLHAGLDERLDLLGRFCAALREAAHLGRHHCKAPPLFASTCGLHRCVQREDVGLERDAIDHADDVCNLLAALVNVLHGAHHLLHDLAAFGGCARRRGGQLVGLACGIGTLAHRGRQLLHAGSRLLQAAGSLLGALAQVLVAGADVLAGGTELVHVVTHGRHQLVKALLHIAYRHHHAGGVTRLHLHRNRQVTLLDGLHHRTHLTGLSTQLTADAAGNQHGDSNADKHRQQSDRQHHTCELTGVLVGQLAVRNDSRFFVVNQLVGSGEPLLILRLGFCPQQRLGTRPVTRLHQRHHFGGGSHGARFNVLERLHHGTYFGWNLQSRLQHIIQLRGRLGVKVSQTGNGFHFFLAGFLCRCQHDIAHCDGAIVRRAPKIDGRALDDRILGGIGR